jgi:hypothetical protein
MALKIFYKFSLAEVLLNLFGFSLKRVSGISPILEWGRVKDVKSLA